MRGACEVGVQSRSGPLDAVAGASSREMRPSPGQPRGRWSGSAPLGMAAVILVVGLATSRQDVLLDGSVALTYAIAATGLGLALGLAGEFMLGQLFLFAVSAYVTAALITNHFWGFLPAP